MVDKIWYNMEELIGGSEERGINRNILECKVRNNDAASYWVFVLIETYWNVKSGKYTNAYFVGHVLIETYWNVKKETKVIDKSSIKY